MMGALLIVLAIILGLFILYLTSSSAASAQPRETVYVTEERWDPWGWWPVGPWTPHWNPHPFRPPVPQHRPLGPGGQQWPVRPAHPLGPGGEQHMLGPGGERRLMGGARRG
jgi:hypothetical protein